VNQATPTALLIDDEPQIRRLLRISLEADGYLVFDAANGREGLREAAGRHPDIIVLDLGLPDLDGIEVVGRLREWSTTPVVILSARDGAEEKVAALDAGADDYVTKPFHTEELLARLRVALRHVHRTDTGTFFEFEDLRVDFPSREVTYSKKSIELTPTEYSILRLLVTHAGKVLTQAQILRSVWGPHCEEQSQYLRVHLSHLRAKLTNAGAPASLIKTESGIGYRFKG
jgi:two-component system KDP operon response regulator KdpE